MKLIKISSNSLWHISNQKFSKFDKNVTAQGIFWFAKNKSDLIEDGHGANINSRNPVYLYEVATTAKNPAGWDEYDKYGLGQLKDMGYDSVDLDDDVAVFYSENLKIVSVEVIKPNHMSS